MWPRWKAHIGIIKAGSAERRVEEVINRGMRMQQKIDGDRLFVCGIENNTVDDDDIKEAHDSAGRCHEREEKHQDELAWDDVNNC